jgi:hypothetical protein
MMAKRPADRASADQVLAGLAEFRGRVDRQRLVEKVDRARSLRDAAAAVVTTATVFGEPTGPDGPDGRGGAPRPRARRAWPGLAVGVVLAAVVAGLVFAGVLTIGNWTENRPTSDADLEDFAAIPAGAVRRNHWYSLLNRQPRPVLWPDAEALGMLRFDADQRRLDLSGAGLALVELSPVAARGYTLQVDLYQPNWNGGIGVYVGTSGADYRGTPCDCVDTITLERNHDPASSHRFPFLLVRSRVWLETGAAEPRPIAIAPVGPPAKLERWPDSRSVMMEVVVERGEVTSVRWGGERVRSLAGPLAAGSGESRLGACVEGSQGTFRNARVMVH